MKRMITQFSRFLIVGGINTAIDFGIYLVLTRIFQLPFVLSTVISVSMAMMVSYLLHKTVTFRNTEPHTTNGILKFLSVSITGLALNASIVYAGVHILGIHDLYAKICATLIVMIWSFFMHKLWTFRA